MAASHSHDHDHDHADVPADVALRAKALTGLLVEKGVVGVEEAGGLSKRYVPLVTREEALRDATRALAEKAFGGRIGSLVHFLVEDERLSARDRARLRRMLAEGGKEGA